jgi:hypothetical protein
MPLLPSWSRLSEWPLAISRVWRAFGLQPHRTDTFKLSPAPLLIPKVRDIVGLYLNPPDHAVVLCVNEAISQSSSASSSIASTIRGNRPSETARSGSRPRRRAPVLSRPAERRSCAEYTSISKSEASSASTIASPQLAPGGTSSRASQQSTPCAERYARISFARSRSLDE